MRRALVLLALIATSALPAQLDAQRWPFPRGGRGPAQPVPLPPQPGIVARELAYKRLPYSIETYPMVSTFSLTGDGLGGVTRWTSGGLGTRVDYRVARYLSATMDFTSAFIGGPFSTETVELGARVHRQRGEERFYPFADVRAGYLLVHDSWFAPVAYADPYTPGARSLSATASQGIGAMAGVGVEYALTRRFSVMASASVLRGRLSENRYDSGSSSGSGSWLTSQRYTLGVRFNPVRWLHRGAR